MSKKIILCALIALNVTCIKSSEQELVSNGHRMLTDEEITAQADQIGLASTEEQVQKNNKLRAALSAYYWFPSRRAAAVRKALAEGANPGMNLGIPIMYNALSGMVYKGRNCIPALAVVLGTLRDEKTAQVLLKHGAAPDGLTTLLYEGVLFTETCSLETAQLFVDKGANLYAQDKSGMPYLLKIKKLELLNLYAKNVDFKSNVFQQNGKNILHLAAQSGSVEALSYFLLEQKNPGYFLSTLDSDFKYNVNAKDDLGNTPVFYADTFEKITVLRTMGADIEARNNDGNTPLLAALKIYLKVDHDRAENWQIVRHTGCTINALLAHGANQKAQDKDGETVSKYLLDKMNIDCCPVREL